MSPRIAVLASGEGTTLQCIMETFNVVLVISNKRYSGALRRARQFDVPGIVVGETAQPDMDMLATLESSGADLVVLAGYMQKVGKLTLKAYQGRIINTHPSLLPKHGGKGMYGMHVHNAVVENREKQTGITIHYVNENYDEGAIIFQKSFDVLESDSSEDVAEKIHHLEYEYFPKVIEKVILENGR